MHHCPGVDPASNKNEYHEFFWGVNGDRRVRLTTLPYVTLEYTSHFACNRGFVSKYLAKFEFLTAVMG
jgi:hypothetical protein